MTKAQSTPICTTCPRPTDDGAAQCDRCLLRRAQQLHRAPLPSPRLAAHAEALREEEDRKARAALLAREQRILLTPKKPRKEAPRRRQLGGRLEVGESEGGWVVVAVLHEGVYRVRCPYCVTETNKNRTTMNKHSACSSCARRQGKRGAPHGH